MRRAHHHTKSSDRHPRHVLTVRGHVYRAHPTTLDVPVESVVGTVLRFTAPDGIIEMTIDEDTVAVRDLLIMLPLTLTFEDFAGTEKIAYPPREIIVNGAPPAAAGAGDVAIYTPWGNIAFLYAGTRGEPSTAIAHLGTFNATREQLAVLESGDVTITVAN